MNSVKITKQDFIARGISFGINDHRHADLIYTYIDSMSFQM